MTQEEKELLLRDLCGRLPYNFVYCYCNAPFAEGKPIVLTPVVISNLMNATDNLVIKPYLRPMSSMTKSEIHDFKATTGVFTYYPGHKIYDYIPMFDNDNTPFSTFDDDKAFYQVKPEHVISCIDWLNSHYFDYRGLIEKGLAIEAPEGMYNTK